MTKHTAITVTSVLALAVLSPASALATAGGTDRHGVKPATSVRVKGTDSGTISINPATGAFTSDGTGVSSHLGKIAIHIEGTGAPTPEGTFAGSATVTIVTANGDRLTGTAAFTTTGKTTTVVVKITGGTGRFAHASGTLTVICLSGASSQVGQLLVSKIKCRMTGQLSY